MTFLMVYGTLKQGYHNNARLLADAKFLGPAVSVQPVYAMQTGGFPVVWEAGEAGAFLRGEVYEIDNHTLERCDWLESHPSLYKREQRSFKLWDESPAYNPKVVCAWVYLWQGRKDFGQVVEPNANRELDWESSYRALDEGWCDDADEVEDDTGGDNYEYGEEEYYE